MAKKGKSKSIGFFGAIGSLLGCIPAVRNVKKAIGKAFKKKIKKAKNKLKLKNLFKKLKKNFKKKRGKVFTKARKLKNKLSKRKLSKMFKKAVKKAVLAQKKADKRATTKGGKASKAAVKQVKKYEKAQNLKLVSMGLNCVPIFGNIKALYEMGTGKDLITGQTKQTGKKIIDEAELEKYLKDRQSVSNRNRNSVNAGEPITTLEDLQAVVGGGHYTLPQSKPTIVERFIFTLLFEDIATLVDPKSTTGERILAGLSMLPTSKPFKIVDAGYDTYKYSKKTTKIIEDSKKTYTSNNKKNDVPNNNNNIPNSNSKKEEKAPIVEVTDKDVKELGEYIKNIDKGTGKVKFSTNNLPKDPKELINNGWKDVTPEGMAKNTKSREIIDPETGMKVRFDPGKPGANGFEGKDHYHVHNPNSTGKKDYYLDINGNPVPKGSKASHIEP